MTLAGLLGAVAVLGVLAYGAAAAYMYANQDRLLFFPDRSVTDPASLGLENVEIVWIATADGERLAAWYTPAAAGQPTILFLHGNADTIATRADRYRFYTGQGLGALFVEYRGFGASTGSPSEAGLVADAEAAHGWLVAAGVDPRRLVVAGESLGTGIAVILAARRKVAALLLEAPYSSMNDVAARHYGWLPVRWLNKNPIDAGALIGAVHVPVLMQHGDRDRTIPIELGRKLFDRANQPKEFVTVPGADHGMIFEAPAFARELQFLAERLAPAGPAQ
jgi:uncharacterized protein